MTRQSHIDTVAIRKSGVEGWEPFRYEFIEPDSTLVTGGIPRILTRGPRKGKKTWDGKGTRTVVTRAEIEAEKQLYASVTGHCPECYGEGQISVGWSAAEGTKYKPCSHCDATGKAPREAA